VKYHVTVGSRQSTWLVSCISPISARRENKIVPSLPVKLSRDVATRNRRALITKLFEVSGRDDTSCLVHLSIRPVARVFGIYSFFRENGTTNSTIDCDDEIRR